MGLVLVRVQYVLTLGQLYTSIEDVLYQFSMIIGKSLPKAYLSDDSLSEVTVYQLIICSCAGLVRSPLLYMHVTSYANNYVETKIKAGLLLGVTITHASYYKLLPLCLSVPGVAVANTKQ